MKIEVKQVTPRELWRECAEMTTGKPCKMSWADALRTNHSIIRAQEWIIKLCDIPSFVAGHLVRHIHAQPYVRSKRVDRGGGDFNEVCRNIAFEVRTAWIDSNPDIYKIGNILGEHADLIEQLPERFDRLAPTSMIIKANAEEIINISRDRLCRKASKETQDVWRKVVELIGEQDPDLANFCVPKCIFRGGICPESKSCGFIKSELGKGCLTTYGNFFHDL